MARSCWFWTTCMIGTCGSRLALGVIHTAWVHSKQSFLLKWNKFQKWTAVFMFPILKPHWELLHSHSHSPRHDSKQVLTKMRYSGSAMWWAHGCNQRHCWPHSRPASVLQKLKEAFLSTNSAQLSLVAPVNHNSLLETYFLSYFLPVICFINWLLQETSFSLPLPGRAPVLCNINHVGYSFKGLC